MQALLIFFLNPGTSEVRPVKGFPVTAAPLLGGCLLVLEILLPEGNDLGPKRSLVPFKF